MTTSLLFRQLKNPARILTAGFFLFKDRPEPETETLPQGRFFYRGPRRGRFHVISVVDTH